MLLVVEFAGQLLQPVDGQSHEHTEERERHNVHPIVAGVDGCFVPVDEVFDFLRFRGLLVLDGFDLLAVFEAFEAGLVDLVGEAAVQPLQGK